MTERSTVPCNGCKACCKLDIMLRPSKGDKLETYDYFLTQATVEGATIALLKKKPDGTCVYLGPNGCTIYDRAPYACQTFDCRELYASLKTRQQRRALARERPVYKDVFDAAQERLDK